MNDCIFLPGTGIPALPEKTPAGPGVFPATFFSALLLAGEDLRRVGAPAPLHAAFAGIELRCRQQLAGAAGTAAARVLPAFVAELIVSGAGLRRVRAAREIEAVAACKPARGCDGRQSRFRRAVRSPGRSPALGRGRTSRSEDEDECEECERDKRRTGLYTRQVHGVSPAGDPFVPVFIGLSGSETTRSAVRNGLLDPARSVRACVGSVGPSPDTCPARPVLSQFFKQVNFQ